MIFEKFFYRNVSQLFESAYRVEWNGQILFPEWDISFKNIERRGVLYIIG